MDGFTACSDSNTGTCARTSHSLHITYLNVTYLNVTQLQSLYHTTVTPQS